MKRCLTLRGHEHHWEKEGGVHLFFVEALQWPRLAPRLGPGTPSLPIKSGSSFKKRGPASKRCYSKTFGWLVNTVQAVLTRGGGSTLGVFFLDKGTQPLLLCLFAAAGDFLV